MFSVPEGYSCVVRNSDTQLYAYTSNRRDVYTANGFSWQKTGSSTSSGIPNNPVCVETPQYPSSLLPPVIISAVIIILCFMKLILNMFMGVRR